MNIKEEIEQHMINQSVYVDTSCRISTAGIPLLKDPFSYLALNRDVALKVYNQQLKQLAKYPNDEEDVLKSEKKLHDLGFFEYVKSLPVKIQQSLHQSQLKNYIPWRTVWKENSVSTPCRVVFDASIKTRSGYALNDLLVKGRNRMNKLVEIFIRGRGHVVGIHTDVAKMFNSVRLDSSHWCLQQYLWQEMLDSSKPPEEKVIKTLIYGTKFSGNQSKRALRETARICKDQYPDM